MLVSEELKGRVSVSDTEKGTRISIHNLTNEEYSKMMDALENDRIGILRCPICDEFELGKTGDEDHLPNLYCYNCKKLYGLWDDSYDIALQIKTKIEKRIEELNELLSTEAGRGYMDRELALLKGLLDISSKEST